MNKPKLEVGKIARIRELSIIRYMHKNREYMSLSDIVNNLKDANYNQTFVALHDLFKIGLVERGLDENLGRYRISFEGKQYMNWRLSAENLVGI